MPINDDLWQTPAVKGDVSGPVIETSISLDIIIDALRKLQKGEDISEEIQLLEEKSDQFDRIFDELTGWVSE